MFTFIADKRCPNGAGWLAKSYATDGRSDASYADALSISDDIVVEQTEYTYDGSGNVVQQTTRQRFHDAAVGGTDALTGNLGAASLWTRNSYKAFYYDDASRRLTGSADYGTNGGSSFIRPGSLASHSDTVLVTSYVYDQTSSTAAPGTWFKIAASLLPPSPDRT